MKSVIVLARRGRATQVSFSDPQRGPVAPFGVPGAQS